MQAIVPLIQQWAFTPPPGFEATLSEILVVVCGAAAATLIGVWFYKKQKARANKVHA
jgi:hypothetical protein